MPDKQAADFAECRSLGHSWRHKGTFGSDDPGPKGISRPLGFVTGMVGLHSQCSVCKTSRVKWMTRSGEVISRYAHPDGYSQHGDDKLTSQGWRRSFVARIFEDFQ